MNSPAPTILIVDDDAQSRRLLTVLLRPDGYRTESAASGQEALHSVTHSPPDLILLDLAMPGIDGYQVANILKSNPATANIPIIMVSAQGAIGTRIPGVEAGAEEFLSKPIDSTELGLRVRNLLRLKDYGELQEHSFVLEKLVAERTAELERFRAAMDATADAIMLVSRDSMHFVEVNAASCKMLGYTRDEMLELGPVALGAVTREEMELVFDTVIVGQASPKLSEVSLRCKNGELVHVEINRQAMLSANNWIIVSVVRDITERRQAQQDLQHQADHDALTGLPNRAVFYKMLHQTIAMAHEHLWKVAVIFIDIDHFKNINDTLGHDIGDALLMQFGARLTTCVRPRDTVSRLGGDEFGLMLVMEQGHEVATQIVSKIRYALRIPFKVEAYEAILTASIGITIYPDDGDDPDALIKYADTAMYRAKHAGRNTCCFFTAQMNVDVLQRQDMENALRKAIDNDEFELYYQPKIMSGTGAVVGMEALLRWNRPGHGLIPPALFIPVLEESGLIVSVGRWVIDAACRQIRQWQLGETGPIQVSVNVACRQFIEGDLENDVASALATHEIPDGLLELELTETSLMVNTDRTIECLQNLRARGVKISIDDFGTGYSSLAYLRRFPIDKLKIDIAFIREVTSSPDDAAIVNAIITMAHSLSLIVVAEGVETSGQKSYLIRQHCDHIQGYFVSRPLPAEAATEWIAEQKLHFQPATPTTLCQTLLIVDDDAFTLDHLSTELDDGQFRVLQAQSAAQAFEILAQNEVHVILCDQSMPEMDGTVFLDAAKSMYPDTFRIILSGKTNLEDMMAAVNRGTVHRFYTKPSDMGTLAADIQQAFLHTGSKTAVAETAPS